MQRMQERGTASNSELISRTSSLVHEAFENNIELAKIYDVSKFDHDDLVYEAFNKENMPSNDMDRSGWLNLLGASYLGYALQQKLDTGRVILEKDFVKAVESQLGDDEFRWGDTWKKRTIKGQLDRTYFDFTNYVDKDKNGNEPLSWLKVAGNVIICLTRLDNPDYQTS